MDELLGLVTAKAQEWLGSSFDEKTREEGFMLIDAIRLPDFCYRVNCFYYDTICNYVKNDFRQE